MNEKIYNNIKQEEGEEGLSQKELVEIRNEINTIIFDLGGVYFTDGTKQAIKNISSKYNIPENKIEEVLKGDLGTQYRVGEITVDEFWGKAKELWNNKEIQSKDLSDIWLEGYKPINGTIDIIKKLKEKGYEIIFLSDNVKERVDHLENKYNFLSNFKDGVFSHVVGTRKPDPVIYQHALNISSNPPGECVYIDDKDNLLIPARELGMKTIHFVSPEQTKEDLIKLGIKLD